MSFKNLKKIDIFRAKTPEPEYEEDCDFAESKKIDSIVEQVLMFSCSESV